MTNEEAAKILKLERDSWRKNPKLKVDVAIKALEQKPCEDCISRDLMTNALGATCIAKRDEKGDLIALCSIDHLPSATPKSMTGHCKDCKYFEYDSMAKVDGVPLIVAHEICSKWGNGCKTKEDGYCFLFEPQESEE